MKKTIWLSTNDMKCSSCEKIISKTLKKLNGTISNSVSYDKSLIEVTYETSKNSKKKIIEALNVKGYKCFEVDSDFGKKSSKTYVGYALFGIGLLLVVYFFNLISTKFIGPEISSNLSYGLLFVLGLFTGLHCVSMCGGFVVSYTTKYAKAGKSSYLAHIEYGVSKTISYTLIGAFFGFLGTIVAFTPTIRGYAGIFAGLFLVIFGVNMLNLVPGLKKFRIKIPLGFLKFVGRKNRENSGSPIVLGLLNGLMIACGPLQALYIMAAGTGSVFEGAIMLFIFGLGTLPFMLGFGVLTSYLSGAFTRNVLKVSGFIVIVLGVSMISNGLILTGNTFSFGFNSESSVDISSTDGNPYVSVDPRIEEENRKKKGFSIDRGDYQEIHMDVTRYGWGPNKFYLKKGVPVKWIINGKEINGCNNAIVVPKYRLEFDIKRGEQVVEFTPSDNGVVGWSCWMGMIRGSFVVEDEFR